MILVLASRRDAAAGWLVNAWGPQARLLTPDDLSSPGWRIRTGDPAASRAVVGGAVVEVGELTGVVTRLPAVTPGEVRRIQPGDRDYAASEMSAFLNHWLSALPCPVLNPPVATSLCGPGWRSEKWVTTARWMGMPVYPRGRDVLPYRGAAGDHSFPGRDGPGAPGGHDEIRVTVIGAHCVGAGEPALAEFARALAAAARAPMLTVLFGRDGSEVRFVDAHPWVNAYDPEVGRAMLDHFAAAPAPGPSTAGATP